MDYGPSTYARDKCDRFHSWDYDSDTEEHPLSLPPEQLISIEVLPDTFDPGGVCYLATQLDHQT